MRSVIITALVLATGLGMNNQSLADSAFKQNSSDDQNFKNAYKDVNEVLDQNPQLDNIAALPRNIIFSTSFSMCRFFNEWQIRGDHNLEKVLNGVTPNNHCLFAEYQPRVKSWETQPPRREFVFVLYTNSTHVWRVYETNKNIGAGASIRGNDKVTLLAEFDQSGNSQGSAGTISSAPTSAQTKSNDPLKRLKEKMKKLFH